MDPNAAVFAWQHDHGFVRDFEQKGDGPVGRRPRQIGVKLSERPVLCCRRPMGPTPLYSKFPVSYATLQRDDRALIAILNGKEWCCAAAIHNKSVHYCLKGRLCIAGLRTAPLLCGQIATKATEEERSLAVTLIEISE